MELLEGDLADLAVAQKAVLGVDYVLHQAAIPSVPQSVDDPITSNRANIDATLNVLVAARDARSSAWCMPARRQRTATPRRCRSGRTCRRTRCPRMRFRSWWGSSISSCSPALYGLETVTIRYFNVFGPRQDPSSPYSGVISVFTRALLENRAPIIYGDGEQTRDFTYIANVVDGVLRAVTDAERLWAGGERRHRHPHFTQSVVCVDARYFGGPLNHRTVPRGTVT